MSYSIRTVTEGNEQMTNLISHIISLNTQTQKWIDEDPENRWAGLLTEDPNHWAEYGVYTAEQFDRYMMETEYSEMYKEVHGMRPRRDLSHLTNEELSGEIASLYGMLDDNREEEYLDHLAEEDKRMESLAGDPEPLPYEEYDL